jgi:hypothetical protein
LAQRFTYLANRKLSLSTGTVAQYFGYSCWEESGRDENSGQLNANTSLGIGIAYKQNDQVTALIPFHTKFYSSDDALDSAPTFSISRSLQF